MASGRCHSSSANTMEAVNATPNRAMDSSGTTSRSDSRSPSTANAASEAARPTTHPLTSVSPAEQPQGAPGRTRRRWRV